MEYFRQYGRRITVSIIGFILTLSLVYTIYMPVYAAQMGTIADLAAHVYESANTDSNIVANVILGNNFPILGEETDESGNVWYLIETDMGVQGYIPAQTVIRITDEGQNESPQGNIQGNDAQVHMPVTGEENENNNDNNLPDSMKKQLLTMEVVNIRENPSTAEEILGKIPRGTTLDYIDTITNAIGEVWYEVSYEDINGFVKQSTVREIEVPVQGTDGTQPYTEGITADSIDVDQLMEIARQYKSESPERESVTGSGVLGETQAKEPIIYDDVTLDENSEKTERKQSILRFDIVIFLSFIGILFCAVVINHTFKKMMKLYRQKTHVKG